MVKTVGKYQIPFDSNNGNQLHYAYPLTSYKNVNKDVGWRDNGMFEDTLTFLEMERGRSAAYFYFRSRNSGEKVIVFMKDLCDMMPRVRYGHVSGRFTFVKRGQNYGCALLEENK